VPSQPLLAAEWGNDFNEIKSEPALTRRYPVSACRAHAHTFIFNPIAATPANQLL
jgi:hypothetical protein